MGSRCRGKSGEERPAAYLEAARRREAQGDKAAAFEDLLRAFEIAPEHGPAAQRLAGDLAQRGRPGAADEVLREHARASGAKGIATHRARLRDAIVDGDLARALGAAFDAGLDRGFDPRSIARTAEPEDSGADLVTFDRLLADLGLNEILAARLELSAEALVGGERARARVAHGRVCAGAIGSTERAVESWIEALVAQPSNEDAEAPVVRTRGEHGRSHMPLVEALIRAGERYAGDDHRDARASLALRESWCSPISVCPDPSLALWAVRRGLLSDDHRGVEELRAIGSRLSQRARLQDDHSRALAFSSARRRVRRVSTCCASLPSRFAAVPTKPTNTLSCSRSSSAQAPEERTLGLGQSEFSGRTFESLERMWQR